MIACDIKDGTQQSYACPQAKILSHPTQAESNTYLCANLPQRKSDHLVAAPFVQTPAAGLEEKVEDRSEVVTEFGSQRQPGSR